MANPSEIQVYEYVALNMSTQKRYNALIYKNVLVDENGVVIGIIGSALDITQQKSLQNELLHQKEELETIFNTSKDGIAILDLESNFLDCNPSYLEMTGFTKEELLRKSCIGLSAPEDVVAAKEIMQQVFEEGFVRSFHKTCIVKNDKRVFIDMALSMMPDKKKSSYKYKRYLRYEDI